MQPRLKEYKQFIEKKYIDSLTKNKDYSLDGLKTELKQKIKLGHFRRIVFTGMGCSVIVAEIIKGFFIDQKIPISVEVVNDYELDYLIDREILKDDKTLFIISSYSGYSQEPVKFYEKIKKLTKNIIFLTSGGKLKKIAESENVSIIYWQLRNPDEQYSLFHAPQFFSILLDIFFELKIIKSNYQQELFKTTQYLKKEFSRQRIVQAKQIAQKLKGREIVFLATPQWYLTLLKLVTMHFNEMAMAPAHRNYFHEFTHGEIVAFTQPKAKLAAVIFKDTQEDEYTKNKRRDLVNILTEKVKPNKNIEIVVINIKQSGFFKKFFSTLLFMQYIAYFLGVYYNTESRELIAKIAGNPWYKQISLNYEMPIIRG